MEIDKDKCYCDKPGHCPLRNTTMTKRMWECCQHKSGLSKEKEEWYLELLPDKDIANITEPTLLEKIMSFGKAIVKHVASGMQSSTDEMKRIRLEICGDCEMVDKTGNWRCKLCGCHLQIKAGWKSTQCPLKKWPN